MVAGVTWLPIFSKKATEKSKPTKNEQKSSLYFWKRRFSVTAAIARARLLRSRLDRFVRCSTSANHSLNSRQLVDDEFYLENHTRACWPAGGMPDASALEPCE